ncbi:NYN domain-containing protein [Candidatus Gracilibacteria bacterium]|nr:NYN domain-containing protein [Candidatus Gracilibacteria bacterium]
MPIKNIAFIDGQNLYMGTLSSEIPWKIDFLRFRVYLREKYKVEKAYYYIGYMKEENQSLYEKLQEVGFVLVFRKHNAEMEGQKKGNVDSDIIFNVMKKLYKKENFDKIILVSGDGDYRMMVDFLIEENRFEKILFPCKKYASSLYKHIGNEYFSNLDLTWVRKKIKIQKKKRVA